MKRMGLKQAGELFSPSKSSEAIRKLIKRGQIEGRKDINGEWYVLDTAISMYLAEKNKRKKASEVKHKFLSVVLKKAREDANKRLGL